MKRKVITSLILVCSALTVWADVTESATWTLSELVGDYNSDTQITADNTTSQLTIKSGSRFTNKNYSYGPSGTHTQAQSKGYTENAIIHIPVFSISDQITITCHHSCYMRVSCYIGDDGTLWEIYYSYADESISKTFQPKQDDVGKGYVEIKCEKNSSGEDWGTFFTSIAVSYYDHRTSLTINDGEPFQSDVDLFVENLTFKRTFTSDRGFYTLMIPFDISNPTAYGTFYEYASHSGESVTLKEINEPKANTPYIFKPTKNFTEIKQTKTIVYATSNQPSPGSPDNVGLYGTYQQITAPTGGYGYSAGDVSGISAGTFVRIGTNVTLPPYRAYLWLGESVTAKQLRADFPDEFGEPTGIEEVQCHSHSSIYNLNGMRVNSNFKGIIIKNGKKRIVR